MSTDEKCRRYLRDSVLLLKQAALEARAEKNRSRSDFNSGRAVAYYEVISLLREQALTFGLSLAEVSLADIVPDRDLI
jgi:hypothetical protein